ncbi:hypothetical protein SAMD00019534_089410 [Acytostelium subglobosum LB1]|uniref:hypothetical protein n=1 Tax=Acytostelium subglobosum LB1 TaxID=1410327 RepID=UPI000644E521|nr:hypothetical protein SAMD00019534_089410 [Acytostelium subglobosum LB1]GAM25766.1 hypothetical protein SAMD00019534_089410 [Acytostelium subglobosum LB1]|eukprot:XP_012751284.1 hypothetical protein SAMD00019534_089410 [Acytostelium subglobosum LB1]
MSNIYYVLPAYSPTALTHIWISDNTLTFNLRQNSNIGSNLTLYFSPDNSENSNSFNIYSRPSIYVNNGVPLGGGSLPVAQDKTYCTSQLANCTIGDKLITGPFNCYSIPIPAGIGLRVPINCTDMVGNQLLTNYIYFNYGPSVSNNKVVKNVLVVDGVGFDNGSTLVTLPSNIVIYATPLSTTTQAFFVLPIGIPITGEFTLKCSGLSSGSYIYKARPYILSVTISNNTLIGTVRLTITGGYLTMGASSSVMVGSQVCTVISNNLGSVLCWTNNPASPGEQPVVITTDSSIGPSDPFNVQFDLIAPSILSITPSYTPTETQLNICVTVNDTLIRCWNLILKGNFSAVYLGVRSNQYLFDYQPVITNTPLTGSTLEVIGINFSPYLYLSISGKQKINPVSETSIAAFFQFPDTYISGVYQIYASGFVSNDSTLNLQPVITNLAFDGNLFISGKHLSIFNVKGQSFKYSFTINNQPAYIKDNGATRSTFYLDEPLVATQGGQTATLTAKLSIMHQNSSFTSAIPLPYLDTITYTQVSGSYSGSFGTMLITGTQLDHMPLVSCFNGSYYGPEIFTANFKSTTIVQFNKNSYDETIYNIQLVAFNAIVSNNITIRILKPTLENLTINEQSMATIVGSNIQSQYIQFGSFYPKTKCTGGSFGSNITICNLTQCGDCLAKCNRFNYRNGMTNLTQIYYHANPTLWVAVSNGTQVNVTAALSCDQTVIPNLLELLSIKVG